MTSPSRAGTLQPIRPSPRRQVSQVGPIVSEVGRLRRGMIRRTCRKRTAAPWRRRKALTPSCPPATTPRREYSSSPQWRSRAASACAHSQVCQCSIRAPSSTHHSALKQLRRHRLRRCVPGISWAWAWQITPEYGLSRLNIGSKGTAHQEQSAGRAAPRLGHISARLWGQRIEAFP